MEANVIKPKKSAFVYWGSIRTFVILGIVGVLLLAFSVVGTYMILPLLGLWVLLLVIIAYNNSRYNKEEYHFYKDRIIHKKGNWFSDSQTELVIKNVTHVDLKLPWLENSLYKTSHLIVQAAGSSNAEIRLSHINEGNSLYENIEKLMKNNGFKLNKDKLLQEERPYPLAVFFEAFGKLVSYVFVAIYMLFRVPDSATYLNSPVLAVIVILLLVKFFFNFMNLVRRKYFIYETILMYEEGWFTRAYSFFPSENLADTRLLQTFVDKIFGLYDVAVSSPGAGKEIRFKNLKNGQLVKETLDKIIKIKKVIPEKVSAKVVTKKKTNTVKDTTTSFVLRMDKAKTLMPIIIFFGSILLIFWLIGGFLSFSGSSYASIPFGASILWLILTIILIIIAAIALANTEYFIRENSMEEEFNFLSTRNIEFNNDHITGYFIKENFIDRWFKTCSVNFWSIGSSQIISFRNIKKDEQILSILKKKLGIPESPNKQITPAFSIGKFYSKNFVGTIFFYIILLVSIMFSVIIPGVLIIAPIILVSFHIITILYKKAFYKRASLELHDTYAYYTEGIFFNSYYYALHDNIKDISTTKYVGKTDGSITFNVAGDSTPAVSEEKGKKRTTFGSHGFSTNYIPEINQLHDYYDGINYNNNLKRTLDTKIEGEGKPALANSLLPFGIVSIIMFPLLVIYLITLPFTIYKIKHTKYVIEEDRTVKISKLFHTWKTSVLHSKIDHININRGLFNKMLNNGTVTINTRGSSTPELSMSNVNNYLELQKIIKKEYEEYRA